jgi:PKD repeat protein
MIAATLLHCCFRTREVRRSLFRLASLLAPMAALAACRDGGVLEPTSAAVPTALRHSAVIVTADYSMFSTRPELNGAGTVDYFNSFDELSGQLVYMQPTPWTTNGVTYTSALNIVLGPGVGMGVASNAVSTEFGAPLVAQLAAVDAFTLFGVDVTLIGEKVPVSLVVATNLGSYAFTNLDVPLATTGRRFIGVALSRPGEYLTGFRFTIQTANATVLLDNVAVGHVGVVGPNNADPEATVGGAYDALEGSEVTFAMSGTDPDGDALTFSWDLGDGTTGTGAIPPAGHAYADNGSYDIILTVADGRGGVDTARTTATIANVAPALSAFSVPNTAVGLTSSGVAVPVSSTFTDPGTLDTHTATLDCGVADMTVALVDDVPAHGTASGICSYSTAGVYAVRLTVRDDDGASDTELGSGLVVVYDPAAGSLAGGGWTASPAGAYAAAPGAAGKLTFALQIRYEPEATSPTGSADFKLNTAKLDFRSIAFDWLAISGSTVRVQGSGTLNGAAGYAFAVVARDGVSNDAIRIRIWRLTTGEVVYDNQPDDPVLSSATTALGGGSVHVQR